MKIISFSCFTLLLLLCSCQKDIGFDNTTPVVPSATDSNFISKVIALDTTKAAPFDTVYISSFKYDNLKRVITNSYFPYNNTGAIDTAINYFIATKSYNGTDSVPFKQTTVFKDVERYLDTDYYTYVSGSSLLASDSLVSIAVEPASTNVYVNVQKYTRAANVVTSAHTNYENGVVTGIDTYTYNLTLQNGNIVSQQDNSYGGNLNFGCVYDNKINPLAKSGVSSYNYAGFLSMRIGDVDSDPTFYEQKNNVVEIDNSSSGGIVKGFFTYKYNTLNYPTEVTLALALNTGVRQAANKILFRYTN